ncbi:2-keto-4-pentenoate hydratase [Rhodococcus opacus]|uniref:4-oxalocrotonate decarboxylase n=1 Tax=Rhodococcus opacus TaxID=37919 RepID=A0A076F5Q0_RHOOP|nr:fumarylacetoacetate hydrolase family protein [Rhodococcus opacus]AII11009.1 4-oxalocrotonate decarboxylase [Rhodococcus opacus]
MTEWSIDRVVETLESAEHERREIGRLTDEWPGLDLATAYTAQAMLIERKLAGGERRVGTKLGLTSRAKQQRMGISSPLTGVLTDAMVLSVGAPLAFDELIHPRVEPEIAFVMATDLEGPGVTAATASRAVASVHAGLEVIDSRFRDFSFALPDVVADNASSSRFVVSPTGYDPAGLDLVLEACVLRRNGEVVDTATGAAVQGNPFEALALAANDLATRGGKILAGEIVLTGGITDAVFVHPGDDVQVSFTTLNSLTLRVEGTR